MRRILWMLSLGLVVILLAVGIVYLANPLSVRTWILEKGLRSGVSSVRAAAERALARGDPEAAADAFVDAHRDASGDLYDGSSRRFGLLPPEVAGKLAEILDDPDPSRAVAAAHGLAVLVDRYEDRDFSAVLPPLLRALDRGNAVLGWAAAWAACRIAPSNPETVKAVLRAARKGNPEILGYLGTMELTETDLKQLLECLVSEDLQLRATVALLLGSLESHEERVVPSLLALLEDVDGPVVGNALYSLERLEHRDSATVRKAIELLLRDDTRLSAIGFLLRSTAFPEALAAIKTGLRESSHAGEFLDELRIPDLPPELIPDLLDLCRGADRDLRLKAINILGIMGAGARSAVPAIEEILAKNEDPEFEEAARIALEDIKGTE